MTQPEHPGTEIGRASNGGLLVSIVIPAFNAARFIGEAIGSVQSQTYGTWEMIVVDDCSRDDTCTIVEGLAAADPRIRLVRRKENGGPAAARNTALDAATGQYVAFLDSDDVWLPRKLERQTTFMRARGAALSFTGYRRISESADACGRLIRVPDRLGYHDLLKNTAIATSTVMVDREKTGPFEMTKTYYDDFALWLHLLKRGFAAYGLREDLVRYRVVGKSVSRHKGRSALWVWRTYRQVEELSLPYSAWCFVNYAVRAFWKYRTF
jgi:teichuronic acid biosynthesis glycosyltransferase TuaG